MKITKRLVSQFEEDQKWYGTKNAILNLLWFLSSTILFDIGVKHLHTTYSKPYPEGSVPTSRTKT
jgi:hypothetical protein